jgi:hypothetical protein
MANPFARAAGTKPATTGGSYIVDGDYDFLIENILMRENGFKGDSFVAELRVERSERVEQDVAPNKVGSSASYARVLNSDFQFQLMMAFMYAVASATGDDLESMSVKELEEWLKYCTGKEQPCRGIRIHGRTYRTKTKKGDVITAVRWSASEQEGEEIAANRAKLGNE